MIKNIFNDFSSIYHIISSRLRARTIKLFLLMLVSSLLELGLIHDILGSTKFTELLVARKFGIQEGKGRLALAFVTTTTAFPLTALIHTKCSVVRAVSGAYGHRIWYIRKIHFLTVTLSRSSLRGCYSILL